MTSSYYRGAHGIIVVYDITDPDSFENVKNWMNEIEKFANETVCILIVGNKCDVDEKRKVTYVQGAELAKHYGVPFVEASAKSGINIDETFLLISREVYDRQQTLAKKGKGVVKPDEPKRLIVTIDGKKSNCCGGP